MGGTGGKPACGTCNVPYRGGKAINHLADILTAYGIDVSAEEIRTTETETLKTTVREKVEVR